MSKARRKITVQPTLKQRRDYVRPKRRKRNGLITYKQQQFLRNLGHTDKMPVSRREASALISMYLANRLAKTREAPSAEMLGNAKSSAPKKSFPKPYARYRERGWV